MVVGPLMDAFTARRHGSSMLHEINRGNRLLIQKLPLRTRLLFWLTNLPYVALALALAHVPSALTGSIAAASPAWAVAMASSVFHGHVLFSGSGSRDNSSLTALLLAGDMLAANAYGLCVALSAGFPKAARAFGGPLLLLTASAVMKRRGRPGTYCALHGSWYVASAAALAWLHYSGTPPDT